MTRLELRRSFDPTPAAVREARAFLRECLDRVCPDVVDVDLVLLAANELTTNAVLHGRTEFEVRVALDGSDLCIEVTDGNSRLPQPCVAAATATSGRGLLLVDHAGLGWGVDRHETGKTVWLRTPVRCAVGPG